MTSPFRLFKPAISGMLAQAAGPMHVCLRVRRAACAHWLCARSIPGLSARVPLQESVHQRELMHSSENGRASKRPRYENPSSRWWRGHGTG